MLENDPTKNAFYQRCPLFGDLRPIYHLIEDGRPDLRDCLKMINETRRCLISPFLQPRPSFSICRKPCDCRYFTGEAYLDPEIVESCIGYPAALLKSLRLIYWRIPDLELYNCDGPALSAVRTARLIDEKRLVEFAKSIFGVEPKIKRKIDSKIVFRLFALHHAVSAIYDDLIYKKAFDERSYSQELFKAAEIYLDRASKKESAINAGNRKRGHAKEKPKLNARDAELVKIAKEIIEDKKGTRGQIEKDKWSDKGTLARLVFKEINDHPDKYEPKEYKLKEETLRTEIIGKYWESIWDSTTV